MTDVEELTFLMINRIILILISEYAVGVLYNVHINRNHMYIITYMQPKEIELENIL